MCHKPPLWRLFVRGKQHTQLVKKCLGFYGSRRFINGICTNPPTVPVPSQINPTHILQHIFLTLILILSSYLHLGHPSSLFPSGVSTKIIYVLPSPPPHTSYMPSQSQFFGCSSLSSVRGGLPCLYLTFILGVMQPVC